MKKIGNLAFANCKKLKTMTVQDNLSFVGDGAFVGCEGIEILIKNNSYKKNCLINTVDKSEERWTLDTEEDYKFISKVYDELYSDDSKVVLEYTEDKTSHKVIIHIEKDKIIGIDHYYDYQTSKKAELAKSLILQEYIGNQHIEQLIQKDQYIKISFKEEMFSNLTITELKEQYYSKYKELIKNTEV